VVVDSRAIHLPDERPLVLLEDVIAEANPQKTKPLLRLLIDELRVNSRAEILPTYRLITPTVFCYRGRLGPMSRSGVPRRRRSSASLASRGLRRS